MSNKINFQMKQRNDALAKIKRVIEGILAGRFKVLTSGLYRAGLDGKYTLRVDIINTDESDDLSDIK